MGIGFFEASGADRVRTDDLLHAMQALSQLSYGPQMFYIAALIASVRSSLDAMPTNLFAISPFLKMSIVGID